LEFGLILCNSISLIPNPDSMTPTVVSKFRHPVWWSIAFYAIFIIGFLVAAFAIVTERLRTYNNAALLFIGAAFCWLIYLSVTNAINTLVRIVVAPDGLNLYYLLTGKHIIVDYQEITHVENMHTISDNWRYAQPKTGDIHLNIDLTNGKRFTFFALNYANYNEIKEAIRRNRFHLDD